MKIKRLHSFTILELLTVMLISSILITLIYISIQHMTSLERVFQKKTDQMLLWEEFESVIHRDAFYAEKIELKEQVLVFNLSDRVVNYEFNVKQVTRKDFKDKIYPLKRIKQDAKFQNKNIETGVFDELILTFEEGRNIYLDKEYSAKQLMNLDN